MRQLIKPQRIGERFSVAARSGGVIGIEDLINDPRRDENAEDANNVRHANQECEDDYMDESLEELPVVHCADAGDEAQDGGDYRVGPA